MKNMLQLQVLLFFFCAAASQTIQQSIAADHEPSMTKNIRRSQLTTEQKSQVATDALIKYFEHMIGKNILDIAGLERLAESPSVINPILSEQYHTSDLVDTFKTQLDTLLEKGKDWFDLARIKTWAQAKIQELEHRERTRQRVHEETREVHIPMRFVEIPAGKHEDIITHEEFEIQSGTEIQETPVTQFQWAQIMGENPSHFIDRIDSEELVVAGKKIKICPDAPVESISYKQVQEFIKKLNEQDKTYIYALPSVQEYQALMQNILGENWLEQLHVTPVYDNNEKTDTVITVTSGSYLLMHNGQRVFGLMDLVGNIWQWTRDMVDLGKYDEKEIVSHLVFNSWGKPQQIPELHHDVILQDFLRPVWHDASSDKCLSMRLIRYTRTNADKCESIKYPHALVAWQEDNVSQRWHWKKDFANLFFDGDELAWMFEHKAAYPIETQYTLDALLNEVPEGQDAVAYLKDATTLLLRGKQIKDVSPIAKLTNLRILELYGNQIQDVSPLAMLSNLNDLDLGMNQIQDVSSLAMLANLEILNLSSNQVQDVSPLANLTNLHELYLRNNQIQDILPLAKLINLEWLDLDRNRIKNVPPLSMLTNLKRLDIEFNQIQDISSLDTLKLLGTSIYA